MGERRGRQRRWRQWTPEQAKGELEAFAASGESLVGYARRRGYSTQRLRWWRDRQEQWSGEAAPVGFARLVTAVAVPATLGVATHATPVTLHLPGDLRLEIPEVAAVPAEWVAALVRELGRPQR